MHPDICILPGDQRMVYLYDYLRYKGGIHCHSLSDITDSGLVVCPTPFTKDGIHINTSLTPAPLFSELLSRLTPSHTLVGGGLPNDVTFFCKKNNIPYYDFLSSTDVAKKNATLTAEGLLLALLSKTPESICEATPLIIGYGKCGTEIARILQKFTEEIYVYDIDAKAMNLAFSHGFKTITHQEIQSKQVITRRINTIINTAPKNPFSAKTWQCFDESSYVFQVASGDLTLPSPLQEHYIACPGIPGKYAPKTAGIQMAKELCRHFHL